MMRINLDGVCHLRAVSLGAAVCVKFASLSSWCPCHHCHCHIIVIVVILIVIIAEKEKTLREPTRRLSLAFYEPTIPPYL